MSFADFAAGAQAASQQLRQLIRCLNGDSGQGQPINLTGSSLPGKYIIDAKQLDDDDGFITRSVRSNGVIVEQATKEGFRYSPDGSVAGQTPVSVGLAEEITGAKTFTRLVLKRATSTASGTPLTLPTDGNIVPITGNALISTIVGTDNPSVPITLEFASGGCVVRLGPSHYMQGDYISKAGGTLDLYYDGASWHETRRAGFIVPGADYRLTADFNVVQGADRKVTWDARETTSGGMSAVPVSNIVPGILGWWRCSGVTVWNDSAPGEARLGFLHKNDVNVRRLFGFYGSTPNDDACGTWSVDVEVTSITDFYSLILFTTDTTDILGGPTETHLNWRYIGR